MTDSQPDLPPALEDFRAEVRSVIEVSNVCRQACHYCGMAKGNPQPKYLMPHDEFVEGRPCVKALSS